MYEFYIEKQKVDIEQQSAVALTYAIDDINQYGSKQTTFSKPLTLVGTARTNKVLGHVLTEASNNPYSIVSPNVGVNFNPSDVSLCELRFNGLLLVKGIFRLISIKLKNGVYSYDGVIFGELGGFIAAISNLRLQDLDFSEYDHTLNTTNIAASWETINGSGYYYPLIDYGTFSTNKVDYDVKTFRPALYAKEYIDKIFEAAGYTYECAYFNSGMFKKQIIPHNTKNLERLDNVILTGAAYDKVITATTYAFQFDSASGGNFIINLNQTFQWNSAALLGTISVRFFGQYTNNVDPVVIELMKNNIAVDSITLGATAIPLPLSQTLSYNGVIDTGDEFRLAITKTYLGTFEITLDTVTLSGTTDPATRVIVDIGETVVMNDTIPRGIFLVDFFKWLVRMGNLYVTEDKLKDNHLVITPYNDYYQSAAIDWNQKIDYSKGLEYTPMGQLNGRIFEYKYKPDTDFFNEGYQKKYNQTYGDILYDTGYQFSKDRQTVEIGFSPTPLIQYAGTDKIVPAIYKKSTGNDIDQEELMDSNIRILFAKKITGVASWDILDGVTVLSSQTSYGYTGHLDDPETPTYDLNFGAPSELYFTVGTYPSRGLFNEYWNNYIQEIANKDSKILKCYAHLKTKDITELDFSRPVFINGVKWRINKIEDYNSEDPITRVELLKVING